MQSNQTLQIAEALVTFAACPANETTGPSAQSRNIRQLNSRAMTTADHAQAGCMLWVNLQSSSVAGYGSSILSLLLKGACMVIQRIRNVGLKKNEKSTG